MNQVLSAIVALGLIALPQLPSQTATAADIHKVCKRPAPPPPPPCGVKPRRNGPSLIPGVPGPGAPGPGAPTQGPQGPGGPNVNGTSQNNQPGGNQNQNGNRNQTQNGNQNQNQNQNGNNQNQAQNNTNNNQQTTQNQTQLQQQNQNQQQTATVAIPVGSRITLPGNYGPQPGKVYLVLGAVKLPIMVEQWDETGITLTLPNVQIDSNQVVKIEIAPANNGQVASLDITLNPAPKVIVLDQPLTIPAQTADVAPDAPAPRS